LSAPATSDGHDESAVLLAPKATNTAPSVTSTVSAQTGTHATASKTASKQRPIYRFKIITLLLWTAYSIAQKKGFVKKNSKRTYAFHTVFNSTDSLGGVP